MSNLAQQLLTPFTPSDATSLRPSYTPSPLGRGTLDPTQTAAITIDSSALPPIPPTAAEKRKATENGIRSRSYHGKAVKQHANGYTVTRPTVCGFTTPANSAKKLRTIAGSDETLQQSLVSQPHAPIPPLSDSQWEELLKEEDLGWRCFQTDTVDALLEGKDAVVLARTGLGKSMLWVIPFMRVQKRIVVVGFPLKALGPLQQLELNRFNLRSIVASGSHPSIELLRQILTTEFDVLLATYEFLAFEGFTTLLKNEGFANRILYMALDEVHYLVQDESFRGVMLAFDKLRSVTKRHIPLLALTATASPPWIRKISLRLGIDLDDPRRTFFRNYGNRRPEIRSWVGPVSKGHQDLAVVVPMDISCLVDIPQTLIYVDNRSLGMRILYYLQDRLKTALGDGLGVGDITGIRIVHSDLEDETLSQNYADFASGVMRVMVATEVYGAGANPPNALASASKISKHSSSTIPKPLVPSTSIFAPAAAATHINKSLAPPSVAITLSDLLWTPILQLIEREGIQVG
ncbi:hypothetical protein JCM5353_001643 [Sporobolomyces roseus]